MVSTMPCCSSWKMLRIFSLSHGVVQVDFRVGGGLESFDVLPALAEDEEGGPFVDEKAQAVAAVGAEAVVPGVLVVAASVPARSRPVVACFLFPVPSHFWVLFNLPCEENIYF